jgi:hypothetical protein
VSALAWLTQQGFVVFAPFGHSPDIDLIAARGGDLLRIQVKTASYRSPKGRWEVQLCTYGGNQSWSGLVKRFTPERTDYLFALVGDGRRWFIPASVIEGSRGICLGGPKYAEYEVDPGEPIALPVAA